MSAKRASVLAEVDLDVERELEMRDSFAMHRVGDATRDGRLGDFNLGRDRAESDISCIKDSVPSICKELRSRWSRGRIYSNIGSVVIAVNPFKNIFEERPDGSRASIYSDEVAEQYFTGTLTLALEPHVFGVASNAYRNLLITRRPQCIVVSGDSGAGKTETAKQVMHFLAVVSSLHERTSATTASASSPMMSCGAGQQPQNPMIARARKNSLAAAMALSTRRMSSDVGAAKAAAAVKALASPMASRATSVVTQLLESNIILETFGNAETVRSYNSSRFGKYVEAIIAEGDVVGSTITSFLLEKTRVIGQPANERSYHVFYQLIHGFQDATFSSSGMPSTGDATVKFEDYLLKYAPSTAASWASFPYPYLTHGLREIPNINDGADLQHLLSALGLFMDGKTVRSIMQLLTAILYMGRLKIVDDAEGNGIVVLDEARESVASLLGVDSDALDFALTKKQVQGGGRASIAVKRLDAAASRVVLATMSKAVYSGLFLTLIRTMNKVMTPSKHSRDLRIGTLDIYGFEILTTNSFEQFLINFVNEKLQSVFIDRILRAQQEEYAEEALDWVGVEYENNAPTCSLLEKKRGGILGLLDEQCTFKNASPSNFVGFLRTQCSSHASFVTPKPLDPPLHFKVSHYAGIVAYDASQFIEKNRDELNEELQTLLSASSVPFFTDILLPDDSTGVRSVAGKKDRVADAEAKSDTAEAVAVRTRAGGGAGGKKRAATVGQQFKEQVNLLMETLQETDPHFIRCLKPNETKHPDIWDEARMEEQVIFNGIPENIRIAQSGFVWRVEWAAFLNRYKLLSLRTWPNYNPDASEEACKFVLEDADIASEKYAIGKKSKVFIKDHFTVERLEELRRHARERIIIAIQKPARGYTHRRAFTRMRLSAVRAAALWRRRVASRSFQSQRRAVLSLQRQSRGCIQRRAFALLKRRNAAGCVVTTFAHGWIVRHRTVPPEWLARIKAAGEAVRQRKREAKAALRLQAVARRGLARQQFLRQRGGSVALQTVARRRAARRAFMVQKTGAVRIQSLSRMRAARSAWRKEKRAMLLIAIRLRIIVARTRLRMQRREQELQFKLTILRGIMVTRVEHQQAPQQKLWTDPAIQTLKISWLPQPQGKRPDENPMRMSQLAGTRILAETDDAAMGMANVLEITGTNGQTWRLAMPDKETRRLVVTGLALLTS